MCLALTLLLQPGKMIPYAYYSRKTSTIYPLNLQEVAFSERSAAAKTLSLTKL